VRPEAPLSLARLERALLARVCGEEPLADAALAELGVESALGVGARERVETYRRMYGLRLAREVAREFPATRALLGAARFEALARAFVAQHASRSFTLEGYAAGLAGFLRGCEAIPDPETRAAARDLARLERALACAQSAPAVERAELGARIARARELGGAARLQPAAGARLIGFAHDVEVCYARWLAGGRPGALQRAATLLALYRQAGRVRRQRVARREARLLRALLRGERLDAAVAEAAAGALGPASIRDALARWVAAGLLLP